MKRVAIPLLIVMASITTALSLWGVVTMMTGEGNVGGRFSQGLSPSLDAGAFAATSERVNRETLARAEALSRQSLALSPYANQARMQLAFIDVSRHGRMTRDGVQVIAQSYDLVPIDYTVARYRLKLSLENWEALPPETQQAVRKEAMAFARVRSEYVGAREILDSIQSPPGRAIATVWKSQLDYGGAEAF